jgi:hypothetical protein
LADDHGLESNFGRPGSEERPAANGARSLLVVDPVLEHPMSRADPASNSRAETNQSDRRSPQLQELAMAIGMRADEVKQRTMDLVYPGGMADRPSDAYLEYREARTLFGTLVIARWLFCGVATDQEEMEWMSQGGAMAARENISIVETTRGYHHWRNVLIEVAREEAAHLATPAELLEEVVLVVRRSADARSEWRRRTTRSSGR